MIVCVPLPTSSDFKRRAETFWRIRLLDSLIRSIFASYEVMRITYWQFAESILEPF
jgi:hypothetical protein